MEKTTSLHTDTLTSDQAGGQPPHQKGADMGERIYIKTDRNGTKYYADYTCRRCGGLGGSDKWKMTGWKCYECGGSGKSSKPDIYKEYTPEYQAKLDERRAKRQAKRIAELEAKADDTRARWLEDNQFDADGFTYLFKGNTYERKEEIKAQGAKFHNALGWHIARPVDGFEFVKVHIDDIATPALAWGYTITAKKDDIDALKNPPQEKANTSQHVGTIGERTSFDVTLTHRTFWETHVVAWQTQTQYLHTFEDADGNVFIWKTTNSLYKLEVGDKITIRGTIKEHSEYNEVKQTVLQRCQIEKKW